MGAEDNKLVIRNAIYNGVLEYKQKLAGQYFLYVFDNLIMYTSHPQI